MKPNWKNACKKLKEDLAQARKDAKRYRITAEAGKYLACTLRMFRTDDVWPNLLHCLAGEHDALKYFEAIYLENVNPGTFIPLDCITTITGQKPPEKSLFWKGHPL